MRAYHFILFLQIIFIVFEGRRFYLWIKNFVLHFAPPRVPSDLSAGAIVHRMKKQNTLVITTIVNNIKR